MKNPATSGLVGLPPMATSMQRVGAAILNFVIGTLPLSISNVLYDYPGALYVLRERMFLNGLSLLLGVLQILFVYYMQGSPGGVFLGLRTEMMDGSRPRAKVVFVRSVPFIVAGVLYRLISWASSDVWLVGIFGVLLVVPLLFIVGSAGFFLVSKERSLLDKVSGSRVVKAYWMNPRFDPMQ